MWKRIGAACIAALLLVAGTSVASAQTTTGLLSLSVQPSSFNETGGGQAATATVTRSGADNSQALIVTLSSSDNTEISLPQSVEIPANSASTTFVIGALDDTEVDYQRTVNITATAPGFISGFATVTVEDDEAALSLRLTPDTVREDAGPTAVTATLTRTRAAADESLNITLTSNNPDLVKVPASVTIPAGQTSVSFPVEILDNDDLDGRQTVQITAIRSFFTSGSVSAQLIVNDDESALEVRLASTSFSEAAGPNATMVTISRSEVAAEQGPIGVTIASSDTSEATVPSFVLLPKDATSVTLPVAAVDDAVVDGAQRVSISVTAGNLVPGSQEFTVTDNDTPRLGLSLNTTQTSESNGLSGAIGTVTRNTPITQDLNVILKSSNPGQASVPPSVRIPRGAVSADFPIRAVDDSPRDGSQRVTITASSSGFPSVTSSALTIFDNEGSSLRVSFPVRETREQTGSVTGTVARTGPTTAALSVTLTLSNQAAARFGSDPAKPLSQIVVVIPRGSASATFTVFARDNTIPDDVQSTTVIATASGFQNGAATLRVNDDDDIAILTISVRSNFPFNDPAIPDAQESPSFLETVGPLAATATIRRNTATTSDLVVFLDPGNPSVLRVPLVAVIPTGSTSATFFVSAVDDEICEGDPEFATIRGRVAGFQEGAATVRAVSDEVCFGRGLRAFLTSNNPATPGIIVESSGARAGNVRVTRADELIADYSLVVDLTSSDESRGGVAPIVSGEPTRVIIPAGRNFIDVPLAAIDNDDTEGCLSISITPSPVGFIDARLPVSQQVLIPINQVGTRVGFVIENNALEIFDNETPIASLTLRPSTFNESGSAGVATGTVTRTGSLDADLNIIVSSTDISEVSVSVNPLSPGDTLTVRIPAGERSASFAVNAVQDTLVDGDQIAFLEARVRCYTPVTRAEVTVRDDDLPSLFFASAVTVNEGGTTTVTLLRNSVNSASLTVALQSTDRTEVTVPASVTIPAGRDRVTFSISGVQDRLIDGDQRARIIASATGLRAGGVDVTVVDVPVPTFSLSLAPTSITEGTTARVTLTRNLLLTSAMTVSIASSNPSRLRVPTTVTIPAGSATTSFDVTALDDKLDNGNANVTVTASKNGFVSGTATASVVDNDPLLLTAQAPSDVKLSSAAAQSTLITLIFTGALNASAASDAANFAVEAGGEPLAIDGATYNAATRAVVLRLASASLRKGEAINVRWNGIADGNGAQVAGATAISAR